jgi:hypothetical protein
MRYDARLTRLKGDRFWLISFCLPPTGFSTCLVSWRHRKESAFPGNQDFWEEKGGVIYPPGGFMPEGTTRLKSPGGCVNFLTYRSTAVGLTLIRDQLMGLAYN